jgi:hypothetical protein
MMPVEGRHYAVELGVELKGTNNDPSIMKFLSELLDIIEAVRTTSIRPLSTNFNEQGAN